MGALNTKVNKVNDDLSSEHLLSHKVIVNFYVFGPLMNSNLIFAYEFGTLSASKFNSWSCLTHVISQADTTMT